MNSRTAPHQGRASDGRDLKQHTRQLRRAGEWFGAGAEFLSLHEEPDLESFINLINGKSPDGSRDLVRKIDRANPDSNWDMTFNAPKSVGLVFPNGSKNVRKEISEDRFRVRRSVDSAAGKGTNQKQSQQE
jgi:conjugative relaxase-like TrwC/TraI family protein